MGEVARHSRDGEGTAATVSLPQHLLTRVILSKRSASKDLGIAVLHNVSKMREFLHTAAPWSE